MSVLKLKPACKDYLWGGNKLREKYNIESDLEPLAEGWMLSTHKDGPSVITNGDYAGKTLTEYINEKGRSVLGKNCEKFDDFPILIKFIDAKGNLSIQVHPSNEYALKNEGQFGKTEAWYILESEPDAYLYYGFKKEISKEEFKSRIENNTLTEVLNAVKVKKGDLFFIPSGTLHAIGKGIVIAEIQQNSNVTYRVYDYGRLGADGKPRALHIDKALDVTECKPPKTDYDFDGHLVKCDYFTTDLISGDYSGNADSGSFVSVLVTDGEGTLTLGNEEYALKKGDSLFIDADSGNFDIHGSAQILLTSVQ